jgi:hypothetical protein
MMTQGELDRIRLLGNQAEGLIKNKDLALFVHTTKIEIMEQLSELRGHTEDDNRRRIALANQLAGLEAFVEQLKLAVGNRNLVVKQQAAGSAVPTDII